MTISVVLSPKGLQPTNQIFTIIQLLEKCWDFNKELYHLFIDLQQAYDSIRRLKLWAAMEELGIPHKLIRAIKACVNGSNSLAINNG